VANHPASQGVRNALEIGCHEKHPALLWLRNERKGLLFGPRRRGTAVGPRGRRGAG
jgi:hypothetical protein